MKIYSFVKNILPFLPKENFSFSYLKYQSMLKNEISKLIKKLIKIAFGKTINFTSFCRFRLV